ncbi:MAG: DNA-processing protein DprA [Planctomycetota bacterium]
MTDEGAGAAIEVRTRGGPGWPQGLLSIASPPQRLWLRGRAGLLGDDPRVAIVGTRAPTPYGSAQAERFGAELARAGVCIVSGLARGVDSSAHTGALAVGGRTIAVLGSGVDRPWPGGPLGDRIAREGLLLSEFPPGAGPRRHHFPLRNRIIAALSDAVLVVEAAARSGSLITARWAAEQGQTVFALPGRVDHPMAEGTLALLREGATPVGAPRALLEDLYGVGSALDRSSGDASDSDPAPARTDEERAVLNALTGETLRAAEVARIAGLDVGRALAALQTLGLDGDVRACPGGLYERARGGPAGG